MRAYMWASSMILAIFAITGTFLQFLYFRAVNTEWCACPAMGLWQPDYLLKYWRVWIFNAPQGPAVCDLTGCVRQYHIIPVDLIIISFAALILIWIFSPKQLIR